MEAEIVQSRESQENWARVIMMRRSGKNTKEPLGLECAKAKCEETCVGSEAFNMWNLPESQYKRTMGKPTGSMFRQVLSMQGSVEKCIIFHSAEPPIDLIDLEKYVSKTHTKTVAPPVPAYNPDSEEETAGGGGSPRRALGIEDAASAAKTVFEIEDNTVHNACKTQPAQSLCATTLCARSEASGSSGGEQAAFRLSKQLAVASRNQSVVTKEGDLTRAYVFNSIFAEESFSPWHPSGLRRQTNGLSDVNLALSSLRCDIAKKTAAGRALAADAATPAEIQWLENLKLAVTAMRRMTLLVEKKKDHEAAQIIPEVIDCLVPLRLKFNEHHYAADPDGSCAGSCSLLLGSSPPDFVVRAASELLVSQAMQRIENDDLSSALVEITRSSDLPADERKCLNVLADAHVQLVNDEIKGKVVNWLHAAMAEWNRSDADGRKIPRQAAAAETHSLAAPPARVLRFTNDAFRVLRRAEDRAASTKPWTDWTAGPTDGVIFLAIAQLAQRLANTTGNTDRANIMLCSEQHRAVESMVKVCGQFAPVLEAIPASAVLAAAARYDGMDKMSEEDKREAARYKQLIGNMGNMDDLTEFICQFATEGLRKKSLPRTLQCQAAAEAIAAYNWDTFVDDISNIDALRGLEPYLRMDGRLDAKYADVLKKLGCELLTQTQRDAGKHQRQKHEEAAILAEKIKILGPILSEDAKAPLLKKLEGNAKEMLALVCMSIGDFDAESKTPKFLRRSVSEVMADGTYIPRNRQRIHAFQHIKTTLDVISGNDVHSQAIYKAECLENQWASIPKTKDELAPVAVDDIWKQMKKFDDLRSNLTTYVAEEGLDKYGLAMNAKLVLDRLPLLSAPMAEHIAEKYVAAGQTALAGSPAAGFDETTTTVPRLLNGTVQETKQKFALTQKARQSLLEAGERIAQFAKMAQEQPAVATFRDATEEMEFSLFKDEMLCRVATGFTRITDPLNLTATLKDIFKQIRLWGESHNKQQQAAAMVNDNAVFLYAEEHIRQHAAATDAPISEDETEEITKVERKRGRGKGRKTLDREREAVTARAVLEEMPSSSNEPPEKRVKLARENSVVDDASTVIMDVQIAAKPARQSKAARKETTRGQKGGAGAKAAARK